MTDEMRKLYDKLFIVEVNNIAGAYDYIGNEINKMDMDGTYAYVLSNDAQKSINKECKILKKFYKGKIEINPDDIYNKYPEESNEHFFLKCLIKLMQLNAL